MHLCAFCVFLLKRKVPTSSINHYIIVLRETAQISYYEKDILGIIFKNIKKNC